VDSWPTSTRRGRSRTQAADGVVRGQFRCEARRRRSCNPNLGRCPWSPKPTSGSCAPTRRGRDPSRWPRLAGTGAGRRLVGVAAPSAAASAASGSASRAPAFRAVDDPFDHRASRFEVALAIIRESPGQRPHRSPREPGRVRGLAAGLANRDRWHTVKGDQAVPGSATAECTPVSRMSWRGVIRAGRAAALACTLADPAWAGDPSVRDRLHPDRSRRLGTPAASP